MSALEALVLDEDAALELVLAAVAADVSGQAREMMTAPGNGPPGTLTPVVSSDGFAPVDVAAADICGGVCNGANGSISVASASGSFNGVAAAARPGVAGAACCGSRSSASTTTTLGSKPPGKCWTKLICDVFHPKVSTNVLGSMSGSMLPWQ
jgi:hypothetical protein